MPPSLPRITLAVGLFPPPFSTLRLSKGRWVGEDGDPMALDTCPLWEIWEGDLVGRGFGKIWEGDRLSWGCLIPPVSYVFAGASGSKDSSAKVGCSHPAGFREQSGEDFLEVAEHGSQAGKRESRSSSLVLSLCPHQLRSCLSWALHGVYFCRGFLPKGLTPSPTLYT